MQQPILTIQPYSIACTHKNDFLSPAHWVYKTCLQTGYSPHKVASYFARFMSHTSDLAKYFNESITSLTLCASNQLLPDDSA